MKSRSLFVLVGVAFVILIVLYSFSDTSNDESYIKQINKERTEKDHFMRTSSESPFAGNPEEFTGLRYFPVNTAYRINANLTEIKSKNIRIVPTSDGRENRYIEYAYAEFDMADLHNKLLILEMIEPGPTKGTLFLAFADATSGGETYGAGRYLDIKKVPGSTSITLDFNKAYNPYCAYNDEFSCPLPPRENIMAAAIEAGEKSYRDH